MIKIKSYYVLACLCILLTACNNGTNQTNTSETHSSALEEGELLLLYSGAMAENGSCRQISELITSVDTNNKPHNNLYNLRGKRKYLDQNQYSITEMPLQMPPNRGPFQFDITDQFDCKDITMQVIVTACEYGDDRSKKRQCPPITVQGAEDFADIELVRNDGSLPLPESH